MKWNWDEAAKPNSVTNADKPDFCWCGARRSAASPAFDEGMCWECWASRARAENLCLLCGQELREPRLRICRGCARDADV